MSRQLMILGASVRAAVTAARTGRGRSRRIVTCDLFADADLREIADAHQLAAETYPRGLAAWSATQPPGQWMYTGGLENYPDLVAEISQRHELVGCDAESLRAVRDPFRLVEVLAAAGWSTAQVCRPSSVAAAPPTTPWLCKPIASCGGHGIGEFDAQRHVGLDASHYCQEWITGVACAGQFIANGSHCRLLGATLNRQVNPPLDLRYAGSIGPLPLATDEFGSHASWQRLGDIIARAFGLKGLFGIDAIVAEQQIVPLEINPRFTAAMELLDPSYHAGTAEPSLIEYHIDACRDGRLPPTDTISPTMRGKAILYADRDTTINDDSRRLLQSSARQSNVELADIPYGDLVIPAGRPILTILSAENLTFKPDATSGQKHSSGIKVL